MKVETCLRRTVDRGTGTPVQREPGPHTSDRNNAMRRHRSSSRSRKKTANRKKVCLRGSGRYRVGYRRVISLDDPSGNSWFLRRANDHNVVATGKPKESELPYSR